MSEDKAAEKIQASFRGYKTRKSMKNGEVPQQKKTAEGEEKSESEKKEDDKSKSKPEDDPDDLSGIDLADPELSKAAVKIQASYRNFTVKKKPAPENADKTDETDAKADAAETNENKAEDGVEDIDLEDPDVAKAALKIQSTFRGYKVRKEVGQADKPLENGEKGEDE